MYTIGASDTIKFVTNDFIPVKTIGYGKQKLSVILQDLVHLQQMMVQVNGMLRIMQLMVEYSMSKSLQVVQDTMTTHTLQFQLMEMVHQEKFQ